MIITFSGPTISASEIQHYLPDAICLPPAAQGDLYSVSRQSPSVIVLIDGYFKWTPATWHKEILWAINKGIKVMGSSSMGALRAAETYNYGMIGVGKIFKDYLAGNLEDDDEVAVTHGSHEDNYVSLSIPMVDIRATVSAALISKVINNKQAEHIIEKGKQLFYPLRQMETIFTKLNDSIFPPNKRNGILKWFTENYVNQKKIDAIELLELFKKNELKETSHRNWTFQSTALWRELMINTQTRPLSSLGGLTRNPRYDLQEVKAALKTQNDFSPADHKKGVLRHLLLDRYGPEIPNISEVELVSATEVFRREHELFEEEDLQSWLSINDLTKKDFVKLIYENVLVENMMKELKPNSISHTFNEMKMSGTYTRYLSQSNKCEAL